MTTPIFITELDLQTPTTPPTSRKPIRRRHNSVVACACDQCHRCKLRCSGEKPNCQRCRDNGSACTYSAGGPLGKQRRNKTRTASRRRGVSDPIAIAICTDAPKTARKDSQTPQTQQYPSPSSSFTPTFTGSVELPDLHSPTVGLQRSMSKSSNITPNSSATPRGHQQVPHHSHPPNPRAFSFTPATLNDMNIQTFHTPQTADLRLSNGSTMDIHQEQNSASTSESTPVDPCWTDLSGWEYDLNTPSTQDVGGGSLCASKHFATQFSQPATQEKAPIVAGEIAPYPGSLLTPCMGCLPVGRPANTDGGPPACLCTPYSLRVIEHLHSYALYPSSKPLDQILALARNGIEVCEAYLSCSSCQRNSSSLLSCVLIVELVFQCYSSSMQPPSPPSSLCGRSNRGLSVSSSGADGRVRIGSFEIDENHWQRVVQAIVGAEIEKGREVLERLEEVAAGGEIRCEVVEAIRGVVRAIRGVGGMVGNSDAGALKE